MPMKGTGMKNHPRSIIPITMIPQNDAYGGSYVGLFANDEQPEEDAPQEYAEEEVEE